jgi:Uma2 family endonuclease
MSHVLKTAKERELTFEEYLETPETNLRHEVIDGVIVMSPSPTNEHQFLLGDLYTLLRAFAMGHELGVVLMAPADLVIRKVPKLRVRQPDLMFFHRDRANREELTKTKIVEIAPDLAVEILSPSNTAARWAEKLADYVAIRVPELWLVDPGTGSVEVHTRAEDRYTLTRRFEKDDEVQSGVLPGLALPVRSIFA